MAKVSLVSLIFFLSINVIYSEPILKIPFKVESTSSFFPNQSDPVTNKYMSQMVSELSLGEPSQKLNCSLNLMSYHSLFLTHKIQNFELTSFYNKSQSSTYICKKELSEYSNEDFNKAETFSEKIQIFSSENRKIFNDNLNFLLIDDLAQDEQNEFYAPGQIGLKLDTHNVNSYPKNENFITQIKNKRITRNSIFTFEFNDEKNGNFIIGKDVYHNNNYLKLSIKSTEWSLNFDKIFYGKKEIEESDHAIIQTENGLIVGTIDYKDIIYKEFFSKQKNCYMNKTKMGYHLFNYFYCDEDFDETKMENLTFYFNIRRKDINFTFTGKDLFFIENGKKYFKIIFFTFPNYIWYFGRAFLQKYQLFFDTDRKIIYVKYNDDFSFISYFNDVDFWTILSLIAALLSIILYVIAYPKRNKRKRRKNEIDDEQNMNENNVELLN